MEGVLLLKSQQLLGGCLYSEIKNSLQPGLRCSLKSIMTEGHKFLASQAFSQLGLGYAQPFISEKVNAEKNPVVRGETQLLAAAAKVVKSHKRQCVVARRNAKSTRLFTLLSIFLSSRIRLVRLYNFFYFSFFKKKKWRIYSWRLAGICDIQASFIVYISPKSGKLPPGHLRSLRYGQSFCSCASQKESVLS